MRRMESRAAGRVVVLALTAAVWACAESDPDLASSSGIPRDTIAARLADVRAVHTPEGIEELEALEVNGSTQWLSIRGLNRENPILLMLHGGPGSPVMGMSWAYQKPWEDFFTVVNWDRRGVGKSFSAADSARLAETMSLGQLVEDAEVVVRHLLEKLDQPKLVAMGYSYGSAIGPLLAEEHPELLYAYVGLGQSSGAANEAELYSSLLRRVRAANDTVAIRELEALQPYPPPDGDPALDQLLAARKWARAYDGGWYGKPDFNLYYALPDWGPEYTEDEAANVLTAMSWAGRHIIDGGGDDDRMVEEFEVPVVFLQGRYDLHTPYSGAVDYFERIEAPYKRFVTFERSSHMIMFEEPGRFLMALVSEVLPLTPGSQDFQPSAEFR